MTKKKLRTNDSSQGGAEAAEDARFSSAMSAPIFGKVGGRDAAKVQIDERFQSILTDDRFRVVPGGTVDAFGRKKKQSKQKDAALQELNRLYKIDDSTDNNNNSTAQEAGEGEEGAQQASSVGKAAKKAKKGAAKPSADEDRLDYLTKLARGEIDASSSSSSGSSEGEEDSEDEEGSGVFAGEEEDEEEGEEEFDEDVVDTFTKSALAVPEEGEIEYGDATHRVSILNCDWENIKAQDLMVILQSFVPPGRSVRSVTVYPSDFGKQRMLEDELHGPQGIWKAKKDESEEEEEEEESENESENEDEDRSVTSKKKNQDKSSSSKKKKKNDGFDAQRLREYELSKLRYYFAIADCDSAFTANALYEELDDVELQDSAMALELRFVPDDLDLSDREIRDQCFGVPDNYKPPDFVVNALQHTNVQCTWDEGEREREKKLTNLNAWRGMRDSDFMQYIASSDSDDEEEEVEIENDDSEAEGGSMMSVSRKKARAQSLRALLLGDAAGEKDSDEDDDEQDSAAHGQDDFFMHEDDEEDEGGVSKRSGEDEEEEMVLTYVPEAGQELLEKKRGRETEASLTPLELSLRKEAEKKKERKTLRKMVIDERKQAQKEQLEKVLGKKKGAETEEEKKKRLEERERLQALLNIRDGEDEDEERLGLSGTKKTKKNRKRGKAAQAEAEESEEAAQRKQDKIGGGSFEVDVTDERFKKVFEGDAVFGVERTAREFKQTPGMQKILEAQRKNRTKKQKSAAKQQSSGAESNEASTENKKDMSQLVNRLKRKFQE